MYVDVYISIDVQPTILRQSNANVATNKLFCSLNIAILVATLRTTCAVKCTTNTPQNAPRHAKKWKSACAPLPCANTKFLRKTLQFTNYICNQLKNEKVAIDYRPNRW